ncbi:unnamed protein product [Moneuplotes crassus]|uniref:AP2/ERF domain-containing protein n=1 Tax=Euplotes crassus TaxID=5936 RepID=A0AAD1UNU9_EUPCR|nr:unnamed protein product [Moneuplotes crassus]
MDQHILSNFRSQSYLPRWGYRGLVFQLQKTYCLCASPGASLMGLDDYCTIPDHLLSSTLVVIKIHSENNNQAQFKKNLLLSTQPSEEESSAQKEEPHLSLQTENIQDQGKEIDIKDTDNKERAISTRRRRCSRFNIRARLFRLRNRLLKDLSMLFKSTIKKERSPEDASQRRRSRFIGVSRNSSNWQALINVKNTKRYIGTFGDELEAAKTYDIYAVALRRDKALLNFDYTAQEVISAIDHFLEYGSININD